MESTRGIYLSIYTTLRECPCALLPHNQLREEIVVQADDMDESLIRLCVVLETLKPFSAHTRITL